MSNPESFRDRSGEYSEPSMCMDCGNGWFRETKEGIKICTNCDKHIRDFYGCQAEKGQRKRHSFYEACANTATGFSISFAVNVYCFYFMGVQISMAQNAVVVGILTVVSIARAYIWRRVFNRWME